MPKETVVLVHGLWMNGLDMSLLQHRLEKAGYETRRFTYRSVRSMPLENAVELNAFILTIKAPVIHFFCHSLGGIIIRHLFHEYPGQRSGRVVTLGTPHQPSSAAQTLLRFPPFPTLLGKSIVNGLLGNVPPWNNEHELGSIAGNMRFGLGTVVPGVARPNDGTVAVQETILEGMQDHIVVYASHTGLLLSGTAARQGIHFIQTGRFIH